MNLESLINHSAYFKNTVIVIFIVLGSILLGMVSEKLFLYLLKKLALKTKNFIDIILIDSLKGMFLVWTILLGLFIAHYFLPVKEEYTIIVRKFIAVILIFTVIIVLNRIITNAAIQYTKNRKGVVFPNTIIINALKLLVYIVGIMAVLEFLGISVIPLLTAFGVGGLAVALALQETLSNLFSGIQILASRQLKVGDYIKLNNEEEGYVQDISWRTTTLIALPNNVVIIPNSKLASGIITNYYMPDKEMSVSIDLGVSYGSDLDNVEKTVIEIGYEITREINGGVDQFIPIVRFNKFSDYFINLSVILRVKEFTDQYLIKHEFIKRLHQRFKKDGIEIPYPIREIHLKEEK